MFKVGDLVRYRKEWCSEGERKYFHIVKEIRLNPVTMEETCCLIETLNTNLTWNPTEVVDFEMIELVDNVEKYLEN